jgi:uncharacterized protein (DUF927 family)
MNAAHLATPDKLTTLRLQLHKNGYHPVPVMGPHVKTASAGKRPGITAWETECLNAEPEKIQSWSRSHRNCTNTGLLCGEIVGVDIDVLDKVLSAELVAMASKLLGPTPLERIGRSPKTLLLYRVERRHKKIATPDLIFGDDVNNKDARAKVEILADGQQFVAFGVHPDTESTYRWPNRSPRDIPVSEIPLVSRAALEKFVEEAEQKLRAAGARTAREIRGGTKVEQQGDPHRKAGGHKGKTRGVFRGEKPNRHVIADALDHIPNDMDYDEWISIGFALYDGLGDSGRDLWEKWSAQSPKNDPRLTARKWTSFASGNSITVGTLFWHAEQNGWQRSPSDGAWPEPSSTQEDLPSGYRFRRTGLYWSDPDDHANQRLKLSDRFKIVAETRDVESTSWGILLEWQDHDGRGHRLALPKAMLAGDGSEARKVLLDGGLFVAPGQKARNLLNSFLLQIRSPRRARATQRVGWHDQAFVLPDESYGDAQDDKLLLQTTTAQEHTFRQSGTLEDWQQNIARYAVGNSRLVLALSAAFAGPLICPCSAEGGGIHFRGASSTGKTTALHVAGSVWGGGGVTGFVRSWRATSNGLEGVALSHCDTLLCLDEISQLPSREAGEVGYMLANGFGKARSARDGSARRPASWRVLFLSSGELGLADKIAEDGRGRRFAAGQRVRIVDVPADAGAEMGVFENLHGFPSPEALARHLRQATKHHYGVAGRGYLREVIPVMNGLEKEVAEITKRFVKQHVPPGADGQVERVAQRFALIAAGGEIATRVGILPWDEGEATTAVARVFKAWIDERGGSEPAEEREGIEAVQAFLLSHGMARFIPAWEEEEQEEEEEERRSRVPIIRDVAGFRKKVAGGWDYFINSPAWKEICAGLDPRRTASVMVTRGFIIPDKGSHHSKLLRIPGHDRQRLYHVPSEFLEG